MMRRAIHRLRRVPLARYLAWAGLLWATGWAWAFISTAFHPALWLSLAGIAFGIWQETRAERPL